MGAAVAPAEALAEKLRRTALQRVKRATRLSAELMVYSMFALVAVPVFWMPDRFAPGKEHLRANVHMHEHVHVVGNLTVVASMLEYSRVDILFHMYVPWAIMQSVPGLWWRDAVKILAAVAFIGIGGKFAVGALFGAKRIPVLLGNVLPPLVLVIALRLMLPRGSRLPRLAVQQASLIFLTIACAIVLNKIDPGQERATVLIVVVVMPLWKEVNNAISRAASFDMTVVIGLAGGDLEVDPSRTWALVLWMQIAGSLVARMLFVRVADPRLLTGILFYQSALELALRATLPQRDAFMRRLAPRGKRSIRVPSSRDGSMSFSKFEISHQAADHERARRVFLSMVIVGEQLAEYCAIILSSAVVFLYKDAPLALPLDYYVSQPGFLEQGLDAGRLVAWTLAQLLTEFAVDTLCTLFEESRGFDLLGVWEGRHSRFFCTVAFAATVASVGGHALAYNRDDLSACVNQDMCMCNGNSTTGGTRGLQSGGLLAAYCDILGSLPARP